MHTCQGDLSMAVWAQDTAADMKSFGGELVLVSRHQRDCEYSGRRTETFDPSLLRLPAEK